MAPSTSATWTGCRVAVQECSPLGQAERFYSGDWNARTKTALMMGQHTSDVATEHGGTRPRLRRAVRIPLLVVGRAGRTGGTAAPPFGDLRRPRHDERATSSVAVSPAATSTGRVVRSPDQRSSRTASGESRGEARSVPGASRSTPRGRDRKFLKTSRLTNSTSSMSHLAASRTVRPIRISSSPQTLCAPTVERCLFPAHIPAPSDSRPFIAEMLRGYQVNSIAKAHRPRDRLEVFARTSIGRM